MKPIIVPLIFVVIAFSIQLEQFLIYGHPWDLDQMLHHETLTIGLLGVALGIILGAKIKRLHW